MRAVLTRLGPDPENLGIGRPKHRTCVVDGFVFVVIRARFTTAGQVAVVTEGQRARSAHEMPGVAVLLQGELGRGRGRVVQKGDLPLEGGAALGRVFEAGLPAWKLAQRDPKLTTPLRIEA